MSVGVADRRSLHVKISPQSSAEIPAMGHGWLGFFAKRCSLQSESWKPRPKVMRADPHSDMASVLVTNVMTCYDCYEFEETLRPPSFVPGFFIPHRFCYPWDWYHITQTASKHSNGTSPVDDAIANKTSTGNFPATSKIREQFPSSKELKAAKEKWEELKLGKAMAGGSWRVWSEHDYHLSCRG